MTTQIQFKHVISLLLILTILLSACAPIQPQGGGYRSAPAAGGESAESGSATTDESRDGYAAPAAPAEESASEGYVGVDAAAGGRGSYDSAYPAPAHPNPNQADQYEAVTAGVTDDNVEWADYLDYLNRNRRIYANQRDVSERYIITVIDEAGLTVHDAKVEIFDGEALIFIGRTDAGGQVLFHPLALETNWQTQRGREYRVVATKGYVARSEIFRRYGNDQWTITIGDSARLAYAQLDLLFLIDATGSMGDEIDKLKATMADIADEISLLPEQPDVRYGLVAYRDRGDAFVVRSYDFTPRLNEFQRTLAALRADGGGDEPEALNEALHRSIHDLKWRSDDTVRLVILVADAPPHLDYRWEPFSYDTDMVEAVAQGIKIFPVGASNLSVEGEYIFRQLAQFTGGKFVFLTYADGSNPRSGPGTETEHDVDSYSVDTLDRLVVRLVREELGQLAGGRWPEGSGQLDSRAVGLQVLVTPTAAPRLQPVSCTINLVAEWNDCVQVGVIGVKQQNARQVLLELSLAGAQSGYERARFDITYADAPTGWSVNIGESPNNNGGGGNGHFSSRDAEVPIRDSVLTLFGDQFTPASQTLDGVRRLYELDDAVRAGETISLEISTVRLGIHYAGGIESVESPYIFSFNQQHGRGSATGQLFAAFNRTIADPSRSGDSVATVTVTLYPAR